MSEKGTILGSKRQKIFAAITFALCIAAHIGVLFFYFGGTMTRYTEEISFFGAVGSVLKIFNAFNLHNAINLIIGIVYLIFLGYLIRNFLTSAYEALGFLNGKTDRTANTAPYAAHRSLGGTCFCLFLYSFLVVMGGNASFNKNGFFAFLLAVGIYLLAQLFLYMTYKKIPSIEYMGLELVRCGIVSFIIYKLFQLFSSPAIYVLIYNVIMLFSEDAYQIEAAEASGGWRAFFLIVYAYFANYVFAIVIMGYMARAVYHVARSFTIYGDVNDASNMIRHCFKKIMVTSVLWGVSKCTVFTYCTNQKAPDFTWELVSGRWFELVRGDLLPALLLALAGYCLYSISCRTIRYKEKRKRIVPKEEKTTIA